MTGVRIVGHELGAGKSIRYKPVEAYMLFGSFADKATVDLRGDTHHESARVRAFRSCLGRPEKSAQILVRSSKRMFCGAIPEVTKRGDLKSPVVDGRRRPCPPNGRYRPANWAGLRLVR